MDTATTRPKGLNGLLSRWVKSFRLRQARRELQGAGSVLDLGCGLCEITAEIPAGVRYLGVERDRWMYERAVKTYPQRDFVHAELEDAGFAPEGRFELLLLIAVWEHLEEPEAFLRRAAGWATPGGRLVLTTPSPLAHRAIETGARLGLLSSMAAEEHDRLWTLPEIIAAAARCGWEVERAERFFLGLNQVVVLRCLEEG